MDSMDTLVAGAAARLPHPSNAMPPSGMATLSESKPILTGEQGSLPSGWRQTQIGPLSTVIVERDNPEFRRVVFAMDETFGNAARSIARFSEGWLKAACANDQKVKSRWLILAGSPGCGKTHALQAAYRFLRAHAIDCWPRWYTTPPSVTKFTWSRVVSLEPGAWEDIEAEAHRATMVLIDDLGSEVDRFKTGEPTERLRRIMEICKTKWLLVTTNVPKAKFPTVFDGRVASRLEFAVVLDLAGALDYRARAK
jgi:hypothetical protein